MTQLLGPETLTAAPAPGTVPAPASGTVSAPGPAPGQAHPGSVRLVEEVDAALTCTAITDITHDVKSFTWALPDDAVLRHLPGQYLTFTFPFDDALTGQPVERCYTISSAPPDGASPRTHLTTTVKKVPEGPVSTWLHEQLRVGDQVMASGPYGDFSHHQHPAPAYVFFSAGSGITPLMSMLRTASHVGPAADIVFVHSARSPADIIFRDELAELGHLAGIRVVVVCEDDSAGETWHGPRGRLTLPLLLDLVPDVTTRTSFTCGPPPYMESVRGLLDQVGVPPHARHEETFLLGGGPDPDPSTDPGAVQTFTVEFRRSGRTIECPATTTLLDGALAAGISLPSSCEEGVCGTCKQQLLCGRVDMRHGGGIRPREIADNKILPCCSTPLDDVVLDA